MCFMFRANRLAELWTTLQTLLNCLCDESESVRIHALAAFRDVLWHPEMEKCVQEHVAGPAMDWLASLMSHQDTGNAVQ